MERLGNIIKYLNSSDYNKITLKEDINYFFSERKKLEIFYPDMMNEVKTLIIDMVNQYRYKMDIYFRSLLDIEFNKITRTYINNLVYPLDINRVSEYDLYLLKKLFNSEDSVYLSIDLIKTDRLFNKKLIDTRSVITDRDLVHESLDSIYAITDKESYLYYRNKKSIQYTEEDYNNMLQEIKDRDEMYNNQGYIINNLFPDLTYAELVGKYGEYKVKEYFKKYHLNGEYYVDQVSKYGDGYGYDIALVKKDLTHVHGLEVKSTYEEYDSNELDTFKLTDNESDNFIDNGEPADNFCVIRYSIRDDKLFMIKKAKDGYYCIDEVGNEHKVETKDDKTFTLTRIEPKRERKRVL